MSRRLIAVLTAVCLAALSVTAVAIAHGGHGDKPHHRKAPAHHGKRHHHGHMTPGGRATSTPLR